MYGVVLLSADHHLPDEQITTIHFVLRTSFCVNAFCLHNRWGPWRHGSPEVTTQTLMIQRAPSQSQALQIAVGLLKTHEYVNSLLPTLEKDVDLLNNRNLTWQAAGGKLSVPMLRKQHETATTSAVDTLIDRRCREMQCVCDTQHFGQNSRC